MPKEIKQGQEVRTSLLQGVLKIGNAVKATMGPSGRFAILDNGQDRPVVTKDGVTVARSIILKDRYEEMGASLIREAAEKTNSAAGDGTSLTCLLASTLYLSANRLIESETDASAVAREVTAASQRVLSFLQGASRAAREEDIHSVALVSSNNDKDMAEPIASLLLQVGLEGLVSVSTTDAPGLKTSILDGLKVDSGYATALMANDKADAVLLAPMVLLTDKPLRKVEDVLTLMKIARGAGAGSLLIFADSVEHEVLQFILSNKEFPTVVVNTPGFGPDRKHEVLFDLKAKLGGEVILEQAGHTFASPSLGTAKQALVTKDACLIIGGRGSEEEVAKRVELIELELESAEYEIDKVRLKKRRANLYGKLGVIQVGGTTKSETIERKHRVEDVVCAVRAALEHGIVAGGGLALWEASSRLSTGEASPVLEAYAECLKAPLKTIQANAGRTIDDIPLQLEGAWCYGFDAADGKEVDFFKVGIVDPLKVVTEAVKNATAVVALLITTEVIVSEV